MVPSRKDEENPDKVIAVIRNTSNRKIMWDVNRPGIDRVRFFPGGAVGVNAQQLQSIGKLPPGCVVETYDPKKHGVKKPIGK